VAVHHVEVGAADPAGVDPQENLAGSRLGGLELRGPERLALAFEDHRAHAPPFSRGFALSGSSGRFRAHATHNFPVGGGRARVGAMPPESTAEPTRWR